MHQCTAIASRVVASKRKDRPFDSRRRLKGPTHCIWTWFDLDQSAYDFKMTTHATSRSVPDPVANAAGLLSDSCWFEVGCPKISPAFQVRTLRNEPHMAEEHCSRQVVLAALTWLSCCLNLPADQPLAVSKSHQYQIEIVRPI